MKKNSLITLSAYALILLGWFSYHMILNHPLILPSPSTVFIKMGQILTSSLGLYVILSSLLRLFIIITLTLSLAIILAIISYKYKHFYVFLKPIISMLRALPTIAVLVIMMMLYGMHLTPYLVTALILFPIAFQSIYFALTHLDKDLIDMYKLNASRFISGLKIVYFPMVKPMIILTLIQSFGMGFKVLIMAEYLAQTPNSIGNQMFLAKSFLAYDHVFAWTLIVLVIASIFEYCLSKSQKKILEMT